VKEYQIVDFFLGERLKDEVQNIKPVQKQTKAGQRMKFKVYIAVGDGNGHVGLANKSAKEVANSIRAAINMAKLAIVPVRRGYWGSKIGQPHTVPAKLTGKAGSVRVRLVPAPRGTGLVASKRVKSIITLAGINDVFTSTEGKTKSTGNFVVAAFNAMKRTYSYLDPTLWRETRLVKQPNQEFSEFLSHETKKKVAAL